MSTSNVNRAEKKKISLFKKMMMQLAICAVIYIIFYLIKNTNYIFSDDVIKKTKEFLSYDINFGVIQDQISSFIDSNKDKFNFWGITDSENQNEIANEDMTNGVTSNVVNEVQANETNTVNDVQTNNLANVVGGIGGASNNEVIETKTDGEEKSQAELDIEYIKANYSFKVPATGTVTSRYGEREETEVVSANHQGIDIGANEGTPIYAAMEGTVTVVSEEGEYGKHIDVTNGDVLTRYAHCSKLLVKEGQKVKQGDKIAEVGSTGNSTGPHLHFEIRRDNRVVNPDEIINF